MTDNILAKLLGRNDSQQARREKIKLSAELLDSIGVTRKELTTDELSVSKELAGKMTGMTEEDTAEMAAGIVEALSSMMEDKNYMSDENKEDMRKAMTEVVTRMMDQMRNDSDMAMGDEDKMDDDEDKMDEDKSLAFEDIRKELAAIRQSNEANYGAAVRDFGDVATAVTEIAGVLGDITDAIKSQDSTTKSLHERIATIEKAMQQRPRASEAPQTVVNDDDSLLASTKDSQIRAFNEKWGGMGLNIEGDK